MKKIEKYLASAIALTGSLTANSQVIFVDVDPDSSVSANNNYFEINIQNSDNLGSLETGFELYFRDRTSYDYGYYSSIREVSFRVYDLDDHKLEILRNDNWYLNKFVVGDTITSDIFPSSYFKSYVVGGGQTILENGTLNSQVGNTSTAFQLNDDAYFGFRIINTADTLLGWARLKTFTNDTILDSVKVMNYAYNTINNEYIVVGQDTTGGGNTKSIVNKDILKTNITYSNGNISINNINSEFILNIYSVNGKLEKTINNSKNIDVADLKSGIYFVSVITDDEKQFTKKIFID